VGRPGGNEPAIQHQNDDAADDRHEEASSDIIADRGLDPERISFVDRAVEARIYLYSVTAIDEAGNKSAPASPMRVDLSPGEEH
jgi:hypothetical protein